MHWHIACNFNEAEGGMSSIVKQISSQRSKCGSGSCSGRSLSPAIPGHESRDVQHRIENHPCYSEKAHHRFARIHLAVAPACNIQCNYCNRKYDCSNESRPGVTSERLTPEHADGVGTALLTMTHELRASWQRVSYRFKLLVGRPALADLSKIGSVFRSRDKRHDVMDENAL